MEHPSQRSPRNRWIVFDYLRPTSEWPTSKWYAFVTAIGNAFLPAYLPIVEKRKQQTYTPEQRQWQEIRRGRYVEFNLVHDKGTAFGLKPKDVLKVFL